MTAIAQHSMEADYNEVHPASSNRENMDARPMNQQTPRQQPDSKKLPQYLTESAENLLPAIPAEKDAADKAALAYQSLTDGDRADETWLNAMPPGAARNATSWDMDKILHWLSDSQEPSNYRL